MRDWTYFWCEISPRGRVIRNYMFMGGFLCPQILSFRMSTLNSSFKMRSAFPIWSRGYDTLSGRSILNFLKQRKQTTETCLKLAKNCLNSARILPEFCQDIKLSKMFRGGGGAQCPPAYAIHLCQAFVFVLFCYICLFFSFSGRHILLWIAISLNLNILFVP